MADVAIERVEALKTGDLHDLCDAADDAIKAGGGFGWVEPPPRDVMERYWKGVLVVPERILFVARLDGVIAGSAQLVKPPRNNEAQGHAASLTTAFVAPWARGHGLARRLTQAVEAEAVACGFRALNLDVRETQEAAIALYETLGFKRWGTHPFYALVKGVRTAGYFYSKDLDQATPQDETPR
ncbi:GNAT family N-acetyltransferase [Azospirillum agricola]|uniref:GNAT family N-acetyltransferase n=1 Tax=Azospirillum agricola TaxID=1720247 RepID=UPI000A0F2442|nr:GNAT family N-acetyltransferase [Azospirillum agricola]SMH55747.1 Ribosomal protein S18 acetylase RimI [Azospirillum lipoferum]